MTASAAAAPPGRWLELEGAANVRDVGGLPTEDGGCTLSGVLIRSDNLQELTGADISLLVERLGLRTVIDLRTEGELHLEGPGPLRSRADVTHHHLSLVPHDLYERDRVDVAKAIPDEEPAGPYDMSRIYLRYLREAPENVAAALRLLADPDSGLSVVHCAAGKDRTGVVVALALRLVGVPRPVVVEDYVLSAERVAAVRDRLVRSATYAHDVGSRTVDSMRPHAGSMERFLDGVDERYGGPVGFAAEAGVTAEVLAGLRSRLLARG